MATTAAPGTYSAEQHDVGDWTLPPEAMAAGQAAPSRPGLNDGSPHRSVPPWSQRRLGDDLARLGPARPGQPPEREPWKAGGTAQGGALFQSADPLLGAVAAHAEPDRPTGLAALLPPVPTVAQVFVAPSPAGESQRPRGHVAAAAPLQQTDLDIIRAIAEAGASRQSAPKDAPPPPVATLHFADDPADPPPMIIERARAEQENEAAGIAGLARARPSPWPGLSLGFALSLAAGALLYLSLSSG